MSAPHTTTLQWHKLTDRAPDDGATVWVWDYGGDAPEACTYRTRDHTGGPTWVGYDWEAESETLMWATPSDWWCERPDHPTQAGGVSIRVELSPEGELRRESAIISDAAEQACKQFKELLDGLAPRLAALEAQQAETPRPWRERAHERTP